MILIRALLRNLYKEHILFLQINDHNPSKQDQNSGMIRTSITNQTKTMLNGYMSNRTYYTSIHTGTQI